MGRLLNLLPLLLLPAAALATEVTFNYEAPGAAKVYLAGSFNNWSTDANPMAKGDGSLFSLTLDLPKGDHMYKFVADGNWIADPNAEGYVDDGFGGQNGTLAVGSTAKTIGASGAKQGTAAAAPKAGAAQASFRFEPKTGGVRDVFVAGSFNDWDPGKNRMLDEDGDGVYELALALAPGNYSYKFVVDGNWLTDENALEFESDGFGGQNAVLAVGASGGSGLYRVAFEYKPGGAPSRVFLAGSFNDWNAEKDAMAWDAASKSFKLTLTLSAGEVLYKFVADGNWITDRVGADRFVDDNFGGENGVIDVDSRFEGIERKQGDGKVDLGGLLFRPEFPDLNRISPDEVEFTFRSSAGDVERVWLVYKAKQAINRVSMLPVASDQVSTLWRTTMPTGFEGFSNGFNFLVEDGAAAIVYDSGGGGGDRTVDGGMFRVNAKDLPEFFTPDWVKDGVFYQIFPERFRNGDKSNDPDFSEWFYEGMNELPRGGKTNDEYFHLVENWNDFGGLTRSPYRTDGRPDYFSFYGGDIEGVKQKLDYLKDLGVTIIYFNPITLGKSNHKYDAADYMTVDPHFASKEEFQEFVAAAHKKGIRIVVEAVYNHCGDTHWAFVDSKSKGSASEYWDWFEWKKWPLPEGTGYKAADYYECWWGFGLHPNLNFDLSRPDGSESGVKDIAQAQVNWPVVNHLLEVTRYWLEEMDVDGFRMDVPNDVPFWFWKLFREQAKRIKPDAYLIGELWGYAPEWIGPEAFDATMNYKYFRDPVTTWIGRGQGSAAAFEKTMAPGRTAYPSQATQVMMNLVDSHDTVRFLTLAGGDERRLRLAALFAMSYVGTPHIWYGDEIGMTGEKDPDCRRPFYWDYEKEPKRVDLLHYYQKLGKIRADHRALRRGSFRTVLARGQDYAFLREQADERLLTVLHNEASGGRVELDLGALGVTDGASYRFLSGGSDPTGRTKLAVSGGRLLVDMPPYGGAILVEE